jgi:signal transduction histidine kinase
MENSTSDFALIFSIATVGMLILAGSIVLFVVFYQKKMIQEQVKRQKLEIDHQQKMMQATLESQEGERRKLASELHDSIGGMLSTIRMGVSTLGRLLPNHESVDQAKQMLDDTISSVRKISRDLMPSTLEKFGLSQALRDLCDRTQSTSTIPVLFEEKNEAPSIDKNKELMIFRIAQELLNNAIKHAKATEIKLTIGQSTTDGLFICAEDDGIGFDIDEQRNDKTAGKGLGLYSIENRAGLLGAKLVFERRDPKGTKITLTLPMYHEAKL